jgi:hypothetical protein
MENKLALIRWETTQKINYVDLEDLKHFSIDDSVPRKQKFTDFNTPPSGKKKEKSFNNTQLNENSIHGPRYKKKLFFSLTKIFFLKHFSITRKTE